MARKIERTSIRHMQVDATGLVKLSQLNRAGSQKVYSVSYPAKIGGIESPTRRESHQFLAESEAQIFFDRMAEYYWAQKELERAESKLKRGTFV